MTINVKNPVAELRKSTGYSTQQLSLVSGLTEVEIIRLESGVLIDPVKLARLLAASGMKSI